MNITFTIEPDYDADDYRELYTAEIELPDGTSLTVRVSDADVTYDEFRAGIFEELLRDLAEAAGVAVHIEEQDYAMTDEEIDGILQDYVEDPFGT